MHSTCLQGFDEERVERQRAVLVLQADELLDEGWPATQRLQQLQRAEVPRAVGRVRLEERANGSESARDDLPLRLD